jgi:hypothetical protein
LIQIGRAVQDHVEVDAAAGRCELLSAAHPHVQGIETAEQHRLGLAERPLVDRAVASDGSIGRSSNFDQNRASSLGRRLWIVIASRCGT